MYSSINSALQARKSPAAVVSQSDHNKRQKLGEKKLNLKFKSNRWKQYEGIKTNYPDYLTLAVPRGEITLRKEPSGNELLKRRKEGKN